ncbi:sensor histidine kinase [Paenibacillus antri]|uniref:sensor histidine kinase n=1 Tax=Paenibacillus antri TaxID=2582848 RepID=UPI00130542EF|nr:sensor histidine kinase [Paenibacillus antri]
MKPRNGRTSRLRNMNIFSRLLILFIFATMLPIAIYGILLYNKSSNVIQEGISNSLESMLIQICSNIDEKIEKVRNDSIEISYMDEIQDILIHYQEYTERMKNNTKILITERMSSKYVFDNIVSEITLYTLDGHAVNVYGSDAFRLNMKEDHLKYFLQESYENKGRFIVKAMNEDYEERIAAGVNVVRKNIVLGKAIKKKEDGNVIGYMLMTVEEEKIRSIYQELATNMSAEMFVLDKNNVVISSAEETVRVGSRFENKEIIDGIEIDRYYRKTGNEGSMVYNQTINENWVLVSVIPSTYLHSDSAPVLQNFIYVGLFSIAFGVLITALVSYSIISPINRTIAGIKAFETGQMDARVTVDGNDEITILAKQFNKMAKEINRLLVNIREAERQKRRLEIKALQAQINPHFLANTLNMIAFIAKMKNENSIVTLVNAIIDLLRGSMKNDDNLQTVSDEIELLKNYITIQNYRLMNKFDVAFHIDPEIESCLMPKFVLQPIVENAIIHGIEPSNRRGMISITGYRENRDMIFEITDNGVGIEPSEFPNILHNQKNEGKERFTGIGIGNVNHRIKLMFGNQYGLDARSVKLEYTTLRIKLPIKKQDEKHD